jgi:hypothetical protein
MRRAVTTRKTNDNRRIMTPSETRVPLVRPPSQYVLEC